MRSADPGCTVVHTDKRTAGQRPRGGTMPDVVTNDPQRLDDALPERLKWESKRLGAELADVALVMEPLINRCGKIEGAIDVALDIDNRGSGDFRRAYAAVGLDVTEDIMNGLCCRITEAVGIPADTLW